MGITVIFLQNRAKEEGCNMCQVVLHCGVSHQPLLKHFLGDVLVREMV